MSDDAAWVLVDANVILDVVTEDPAWFAWSSETLARAADRSRLAINPIVYAELSAGFERIEELERSLWRIAAGETPRLSDAPYRRTYGFFDTAARVATGGSLLS